MKNAIRFSYIYSLRKPQFDAHTSQNCIYIYCSNPKTKCLGVIHSVQRSLALFCLVLCSILSSYPSSSIIFSLAHAISLFLSLSFASSVFRKLHSQLIFPFFSVFQKQCSLFQLQHAFSRVRLF